MSFTKQTEGAHGPEFLLSEANGNRSRSTVVIGASQTLTSGAPLGRRSTGTLAVVAAAVAGNTGNGALGSWTVAAGTPKGVYRAVCMEAAANAGTFRVEDTGGVEIGELKVGVAFNKGGLAGTVADGGTDFVAGDAFTLTVSDTPPATLGQCFALNPAATDGTQTWVGFVTDNVTTTASGAGSTAAAVVIDVDAEVINARIPWGSLNGGQQAAILATALAAGVKAR